MNQFQHIRSIIYGQPWLIEDGWLGSICEIFEAHVAKLNTDARAMFPAQHETEAAAPYDNCEGVAVVEIEGPLFPKANMMQKLSGASSYSQIGSNIQAAIDDEDVKEVLLHINSPGGSTMGAFELASKIDGLREVKEITSHIEGAGCSAAYLIASQTSHIACSEGSRVGSIGVYAAIKSTDRAERNMGIDTTIVRSSELKGAGEGPITPNQAAEIYRMVRTQTAMFKDAVMRNRQTELREYIATSDPGAIWIGEEAQERGLVDSVSSFESYLLHRQKLHY